MWPKLHTVLHWMKSEFHDNYILYGMIPLCWLLQCHLSHFIAIPNYSPIASWDSKVYTGCTLQNLTGRSSGYFFCLLFYTVNLHILFFSHTVFHLCIVMKYAKSFLLTMSLCIMTWLTSTRRIHPMPHWNLAKRRYYAAYLLGKGHNGNCVNDVLKYRLRKQQTKRWLALPMPLHQPIRRTS